MNWTLSRYKWLNVELQTSRFKQYELNFKLIVIKYDKAQHDWSQFVALFSKGTAIRFHCFRSALRWVAWQICFSPLIIHNSHAKISACSPVAQEVGGFVIFHLKSLGKRLYWCSSRLLLESWTRESVRLNHRVTGHKTITGAYSFMWSFLLGTVTAYTPLKFSNAILSVWQTRSCGQPWNKIHTFPISCTQSMALC